MARPTEESPYRLLVEGPDDQYSVIHLMARHGFDWDDESRVRPCVSSLGGVEQLLRAFPVAIKGTYERIGIVLDANSNPAGRWEQIRNRAEKLGLSVPDSLASDGTLIPGRKPGSRIGIWLMPDNQSEGTLENFLSELVPFGDSIWSYADEVVIEASRRGARYQEKDRSKSRLHTWLAWQEKPGLPFGIAMKAELFEKESEAARRFVAWFNRLFVEA
jgi:hypothetical protein